MVVSAEREYQKMFVIVERALFLKWKSTTIGHGQTITERIKELLQRDIEERATPAPTSRRRQAEPESVGA